MQKNRVSRTKTLTYWGNQSLQGWNEWRKRLKTQEKEELSERSRWTVMGTNSPGGENHSGQEEDPTPPSEAKEVILLPIPSYHRAPVVFWPLTRTPDLSYPTVTFPMIHVCENASQTFLPKIHQ